MSNAKTFKHAELLYNILPDVYREKDVGSEDLKKYLNGTGILLDQIHNTLLQRYADIFPDSDPTFDIDSQPWLLPYMAALFDVKMVSPLEQGQREEIANAIPWRKAKGTVGVVEQVAETIGDIEVVVHEGWKRVATTARIGKPVLPIDSYGYAKNSDYSDGFLAYQKTQQPDLAPLWARHPGLPAGTVDLRCQGGAVKADENNPAAVTSFISGNHHRWRQSSLHGAQNCNKGHSILSLDGKETDWLPGYFDDPSVRTVDFRNANWRQGHFHPQRVLIFTATQAGFFEEVPATRRFSWNDSLAENEYFLNIVDIEVNGDSTVYRNKSLNEKIYQPIVIRKRIKLGQVPSGTGPVDPASWRFEGFIFSHTIEVDSGRLELERCAVLAAEVHSIDLNKAVLTASNCLLKRVQAARGLVNMQYCTVLADTIAEKLTASECIFNGLIRRHHDTESLPGEGCIRYSTLHPQQPDGDVSIFNTHKLLAIFRSNVFGNAGCAVLHPSTAKEIAFGAEDSGEMGAYHHLYLIARHQAVIKKLENFLPTGMKAVIIPDISLHDLPGKFGDDADSD